MDHALKYVTPFTGGISVPVDVYLRSQYEPDAEYVDGEIQERPMGEIDHADWQRAILKWFLLHEDEWNVFVFPELRVQVAKDRFRVPDVTVIAQNLRQGIERYVVAPPVAVFEILSPEDTMMRVMTKLEDYRDMGIGQIWLINPEDGAISRYREHKLAPEERFTVPAHQIDFPLSAIKALLPKLRS